MLERVVAARFDGVEDGEAAATEHFEVDAEASVDHFCERHAFVEEHAGASDEFLHQADVRVAEILSNDVGFGDFMRGGDVERDVDAAFLEVARDVLPKISELERGAGGVGKMLAFGVAIAAEIENETADGIRGVDAVVDDGVPVGIALDGLVLAEGLQQVGEGLLRNVFRDDGLTQCDENRVPGLVVIAGVEFALPPIEKFEGAIRVGNFVAEVVGPAAVGVDVVEMLVEFFGEEPGDDVEIFVVVRGEPTGVLLRGGGGAAGGRDVGGESEFVGTEHSKLFSKVEESLRGLKPPAVMSRLKPRPTKLYNGRTRNMRGERKRMGEVESKHPPSQTEGGAPKGRGETL